MIRVGVDFGGTKIEAAALNAEGRFLARRRRPNPGTYAAALRTARDLVHEVEADSGGRAAAVGVALPGSISPVSGRIRNANSTWLNGMAFDADFAAILGRPVRVRNDANCFALSEATDGAAREAGVVFGIILGTGCGGGLVVNGALLDGANGIAGEWGHTPLPWPDATEAAAGACWCGRTGCLETWISGTGFRRDHHAATGLALDGAGIMRLARSGETTAIRTFERWIDRLGRALAIVCDIVDPDVIVCGGGMSNVGELYPALPGSIAAHLFSDTFETRIVPAAHGDSSGVRGAAWLWPAC
jgi:fructokinase